MSSDKELFSNKNRFPCEDPDCLNTEPTFDILTGLQSNANWGFFRRHCANNHCKRRLCLRHASVKYKGQSIYTCTECFDLFMENK